MYEIVLIDLMDHDPTQFFDLLTHWCQETVLGSYDSLMRVLIDRIERHVALCGRFFACDHLIKPFSLIFRTFIRRTKCCEKIALAIIQVDDFHELLVTGLDSYVANVSLSVEVTLSIV